MNLALNLSLFLIALLSFGYESISLTNYEIGRICKNQRKVSRCIKNLQEKKSNLQKGKLIKIPVIPYKR